MHLKEMIVPLFFEQLVVWLVFIHNVCNAAAYPFYPAAEVREMEKFSGNLGLPEIRKCKIQEV